MNNKIRDRRVEADAQLLESFAKSFELDYIKYVDAGVTASFCWPGKVVHGHRVTVPSLRFRHLRQFPADVLACRLAAVEFTLDLTPLRVHSLKERMLQLERCFDLLFRRMTPWRSKFIGDRVFVYNGDTRRNRLLSGNRDCMLVPGGAGGTTIKVRSTSAQGRRGPTGLALGPTGALVTETVYYGNEVVESWSPTSNWTGPEAQVRLYVKNTDKKVPIAPEKWTCRAEVVLNGKALAEAFGMSTVGDLMSVKVRPIVKEYLALKQALPSDTKRARQRRQALAKPLTVVAAANAAHHARAYNEAVEAGAFWALGSDHLLEYVDVPELTRPVLAAPADFNRIARRAASRKTLA